MTASAATLAAAASPALAASETQRVFVGSGTADGILAYDWDPATAELAPAGVAAQVANVDWITFSDDRKFIYAAAEVDTFNGKPTGEVTSFRVDRGKLYPRTAQNSASAGTCHVALDHTGRVLISADYGGGSAASFLITDGKLSPAVWTEHYTVHGPNKDRQQSAHAHFASFSPDNRFAYINDLGGDMIHIYSLNEATAVLTPAGAYHAKPGAGCRTLHFHPNGRTAYCVNQGPTRACDTVISKDGRFVYFANRDNDFLYNFHADPQTGALTPIGRSNCGGKIPRNFVLDPTERWMLVANQDSNLISVFARNPETGVLAEQGKSYKAAAPMCILFG